MTTYSVSRSINAGPTTVWGLLTDSGSYPDWNPAVLGIEGDISPGETIKLTSIVNPERQFKLKVTGFDPPASMVWSEGMPLGLFKGVRTYSLKSGPAGTTEFSMQEVFSGLLAPLITKSIPDMTDSFEMLADGLKEEAEKRAG
jgi:hypothetical protein